MKSLFVFALCLVACFAKNPDALVSQKFAEFVKTYNKQYSPAEFERRMEVFADSLERIDALNAANDGATYGITQFADMSPEEFRRFPCGVDKLADLNNQRPEFVPSLNEDPIDVSDLPASWDWTTKGAVTPIKNQAQCGSCWAFSTIGNIEGVNFLATKKLVGLSEQQEVSCSTTDYGCSGGWPFWAMSDMIKNYGGRIDTEAGYPYTSGGGDNGQCQFSPSDVGTTIKSYKSYCTESTAACKEQEVMSLLVNQGPLSACLDAEPMQYYTGGIQNPSNCDPNAIDHCITIVGYGTQNGQDFWKIKNSWGTGWGEDGYYYLIRGTGACGINKVITIASV